MTAALPSPDVVTPGGAAAPVTPGGTAVPVTPGGAKRRPGAQRLSLHRGPQIPGKEDIFALASVLLSYPDAELIGLRTELVHATESLPHSAPAKELVTFARWFESADADALPVDYVRTFDMRRRTALHVTYFVYGDTRNRGMALLELKQRYRLAGFAPSDTELPDFLPMLLQFAAEAPDGHGEAALRTVRTGIELLFRSLKDAKSPYAHVVDAIRRTLGDLSAKGNDVVEGLIATGPPTEEVGAGPATPGLLAMPGPTCPGGSR
jgi:nitrate reductase delta subunit